MDDMLGLIIRISVMYIYALAALRISGKRSIGDLSPLDFTLALMIGDLFDDIIWGEEPLANGIVALTTLLFWPMVLAMISHFSRAFDRSVVGSTGVLVVEHGSLRRQGMDQERTSDEDIHFEMRLKGEEKQDEVKEAYWEPSGQLSILKTEEARPVQKSEANQVKKVIER